jgi:hypothetical protein
MRRRTVGRRKIRWKKAHLGEPVSSRFLTEDFDWHFLPWSGLDNSKLKVL